MISLFLFNRLCKFTFMKFYDVHTHRKNSLENVLSIYNLTSEEIFGRQYEEKEDLFYSAGIHPWESDSSLITLELLEKVLQYKKIVALGEVGLDKVCQVPFEVQKQIFKQQIELAIQYDLPLIIHCVKAWDELIAIRRQTQHNKSWIIHGFRGGKEQLKQLEKFNFIFSFGEYYNREALLAAYPSKMLIETDESNLQISQIYNQIASDIQCNIAELQQLISQNVSCVFDL